jgi:dynein light intermediate chain 1, cytosolic
MIVCHKIDLLFRNDKQARLLQNQLDIIQKHIRREALLYGASVMFTSAAQGAHKNLDILYQYCVHRLYDFTFPHTSQITEKESIFIPAGFDSLRLINQIVKTEAKGEVDPEDVDEEPVEEKVERPFEEEI